MNEEEVSRKSSVTIHLPSMSPTTTDLSFDARDSYTRLSTLESQPTRFNEYENHTDNHSNDVNRRPGIVSENTECVLMTEKEIEAWDSEFCELVDKFKTQQQRYSAWENKLKNRRISACDRLKNLRRFREKRFELYDRVDDYINNGVGSLRGDKTDEEKTVLD